MNKTLLTLASAVLMSLSGHAQGIQFADGTFTSGDTKIAGAANTKTDLNLQLLLGTSAGSITNVVATLLLDNSITSSGTLPMGSVRSATGDITVFGSIYDNSGASYSLASYAGTTVYLQVEAWNGVGMDSYTAALNSKITGEYTGISQIFQDIVPASSTAQPVDISGVGIINLSQVSTLTVVPEPSTLAMSGVSLAAMILFRRRK